MTGLCGCGCGRETEIATMTRTKLGHVKGQPKPFYGQHRVRITKRLMVLRRHSNGRWFVYGRDGSRTYWYRVVAGNTLGRELRKTEVVHHINGDVTDDRAENLMVLTQGEHAALHIEARTVRVPCKVCGERPAIGWGYCKTCKSRSPEQRAAQRRYYQRQKALR